MYKEFQLFGLGLEERGGELLWVARASSVCQYIETKMVESVKLVLHTTLHTVYFLIIHYDNQYDLYENPVIVWYP